MSHDRQQPSLGPPPAELTAFPTRALSSTDVLYRVTRKGRGPWWFSSTLDGRFDLSPPAGTCYLAFDELGALLEVLGPERRGGAVTSELLAARTMRRLRLPEEQVVADLTDRRASGFGITSEIGTLVPYDLPQRWAARLHEAGRGGLVYFLRHDPAGSRGLALFGPGGERRDWRRGRPRSISKRLLRRLEEECGIVVIPRPRSDQLHFLAT